MSKNNNFSFSRLLAQLLITASAFSLAYTAWMIYQNIVQQPPQTVIMQPSKANGQ